MPRKTVFLAANNADNRVANGGNDVNSGNNLSTNVNNVKPTPPRPRTLPRLHM